MLIQQQEIDHAYHSPNVYSTHTRLSPTLLSFHTWERAQDELIIVGYQQLSWVLHLVAHVAAHHCKGAVH